MKKTNVFKIILFCIALLTISGCGKKNKKEPGTIPDEPVEPQEPVDNTCSFVFDGTLCTANNLNEYEKDSQVSITITPNTDCVLPENIAITGVDNYQFSNETGILSFIITEDVKVTCVCTQIIYKTISFNVEHMTVQCGERYVIDSEVTAVLFPDERYSLPSIEDIILRNATLISYNEFDGTLTFKVLGDVTIEASAIYTPVASRIVTNLEHCSISHFKQYNIGDNYSETIVADKGYKLPDSIVVTGLADGYTYNKTTGVVTGVIGNNTVSIDCVAIELYYSFRFAGKYCSATYLEQYRAGDRVSITITPNSGYEFGDMLTVTGIDNYNFSKETGILTFEMTNDVVVTCECKNAKLYYITFNLEHMTCEAENGYFLNSYATVYLVPESGYNPPKQEDIELSNCEITHYSLDTKYDSLGNEYLKGNLIILVKGDATFTASAVRVECEVDSTTEVNNATITGIKDEYYKNEVLTGTIVPDRQYALPSRIIIGGNSTLKSYDSTTGKFEIILNSECIIYVTTIYSPVPVSITPVLSNCTLSQFKTYNLYDIYTEIITPDKNYLLPKSIASDKIVGLSEWTYNSQTGEITGEITGNVSINVGCIADQTKVAAYEFSGEHCSSSEIGSLFIDDNFSIKISPNTDYKLPDSITVTGLKEGYTYNKTTGEVKGIVSGNKVTINCTAEEIVDIVSFLFTGTHCSTNALTKYEEQTIIELDIIPEFKYKLPESYTVTGLEDITYNKETGIFTAKIVSNATLEIEAIKITDEYSYAIYAENCKENPSGTAVYGDKVEVTIVPNIAHVLPLTIESSSGCKDLQYDPSTGKITFVVIGEIYIELYAEYAPKQFSFSLTGTHVRCNAPLVVQEGEIFFYSLIPDKEYLLPDNIVITGLADGYSINEDGIVAGIIIGDVSITCDCVYDISDKALLILNCTNCTPDDAPQYVEKNSKLYIDIICGVGYSLNNNSIVVVSGVEEFHTYSDFIFIITDSSDVVEINITGVEEIPPIDFTGEHCSASIMVGQNIGDIGIARFSMDAGYILPEKDNISVIGIEIITYNTDTQILTFKRTAEEASISVTGISGTKNYDSTMTIEDANKLIYDEVYGDFINSFSNCSIVRIKNTIDYFTDNDILDDYIIYAKNNFNYFSYNSSRFNYYTVLDDIFTNYFEGTVYIDNGGSWTAYYAGSSNAPNHDYISFDAISLLSVFIYDISNYSEVNRCYSVIDEYGTLYTLFFKDGKLLASLWQDEGEFDYVEYSDYGNTVVTLPQFPVFFKITANIDDNSYITEYENYNRRYQYGESVRLNFGTYYGYAFDSIVEVVSGLSNYSFDPSQGILTGTVTGNVVVNIKTHRAV